MICYWLRWPACYYSTIILNTSSDTHKNNTCSTSKQSAAVLVFKISLKVWLVWAFWMEFKRSRLLHRRTRKTLNTGIRNNQIKILGTPQLLSDDDRDEPPLSLTVLCAVIYMVSGSIQPVLMTLASDAGLADPRCQLYMVRIACTTPHNTFITMYDTWCPLFGSWASSIWNIIFVQSIKLHFLYRILYLFCSSFRWRIMLGLPALVPLYVAMVATIMLTTMHPHLHLMVYPATASLKPHPLRVSTSSRRQSITLGRLCLVQQSFQSYILQ